MVLELYGCTDHGPRWTRDQPRAWAVGGAPRALPCLGYGFIEIVSRWSRMWSDVGARWTMVAVGGPWGKSGGAAKQAFQWFPAE